MREHTGASGSTPADVPGQRAGQGRCGLDVQLDDGRPDNGTLRATQGANNAAPGAAAIAYNEAQSYTICRDLG
jgi:hypothetical protein